MPEYTSGITSKQALKGIDTFQSSSADISILGLEIEANDEGGQTAGIMYIALGVIAVVASYFLWKKN